MSETEQPPSPQLLYPLKFQPLLCLSAAFLAGVAAGDIFSPTTVWWLSGTLALVSIALILLYQFHSSFEIPRIQWQQRLPLSPGWLLLLFALGLLRLAAAQPVFTETDLAFYNGQGKAAITGIVIQPPQVNPNSTLLMVQADTLQPFSADFQSGGLPVEGRLRVSTLNTGEFNYGDELRIICTPQAPRSISDFDYQRYLAARRVYTTCEYAYVEVIGENGGQPILTWLFALRDKAQTSINRSLPPDEAALLSGILLGNEDHLAEEVSIAFQRTGTAHIIAISGANFTVLISLLTLVFLRRLPRKWAIPATLALIILYTVFVGGNAAVMRAAIMGAISVFGTYFGRRNHGLNSLAFSGAVFVLFNPFILWDLGFQLSFTATLGLVLFAESWTAAVDTGLRKIVSEAWVERITAWLGEYVLMTLAAQVFTLPLIAFHFRHLSLSSFFINLLILPVQPLIMGLGGLAAIAGMLLPLLGQLLGWLAWLPLAYTLRIVTWGSGWTWSEMLLPRLSAAALWIYFAVVAAWPLLLGWLSAQRRHINQAMLLMIAASLTVLLWVVGFRQPAEELRLSLFPLEDNSAVLLQLPDGKAVLIGRSQSIDDLNHALEAALSGYRLSIFIQPDASWQALNRIDSLAEHFPLTEIFVHPDIETSTALQLQAQLPNSANLYQLAQHQILQLTPEISLTTLAVRGESAAFLLEYGSLRILMPNAINRAILSQLEPAALKDTTVLILNAGQLDKTALLDWCAHPSQTTLINGEALACPQHGNTSEQGFQLSSDGSRFWIAGTK